LDETTLFNNVAIWNQYCGLKPPNKSLEFSYIRLSDSWLLGKASDGRPSFLFISKAKVSSPSIALHLINISHNTMVTCSGESEVRSEFTTIISCNSRDADSQSLFISIIEFAIRKEVSFDSNNSVTFTATIAKLFHALTAPSQKEFLGLWGELFFLSMCNNIDAVINSWRSDPYSIYDFSLRNRRVEVKATTNDIRIHQFSINQIRPARGETIYICSIMTKYTTCGKSISDLVDEISDKLSSQSRAQLLSTVVSTLGEKWRLVDDFRFDYSQALRSVKLYEASAIPGGEITVPVGVTNLHFTSDLTTATALEGPIETLVGKKYLLI
jgi:hypothetical protein